MEIFSVNLTTVDNSVHFLLGMREFTDVPPVLEEESLPSRRCNKLRKKHLQKRPSDFGTSNLGTPRVVEAQELTPSAETLASHKVGWTETSSDGVSGSSGDAASEGESAHQDPCLGTPQKNNPDILTTATFAKDATMLALLMSWEVKTSTKNCCAKHAAMSEARRVLGRLAQTRECGDNPHFESTWQCPKCGILDVAYRRKGGNCALCKMAGDPLVTELSTPARLRHASL